MGARRVGAGRVVAVDRLEPKGSGPGLPMALFLSCEDEFPFDGSFLTDVARPRYRIQYLENKRERKLLAPSSGSFSCCICCNFLPNVFNDLAMVAARPRDMTAT